MEQAPELPNGYRYFCCIAGAIGVGKSTVFRYIKEYIKKRFPNNSKAIPEYIDGIQSRTSGELLKAYLNGELSDACFQNYIQSYYINELTKSLAENEKVILMERCMSDSVAIFCNKANSKFLPNGDKKLSDIDFTLMYNNCVKIDAVAHAPNYFTKNSEFIKIKTDGILDTVERIKAIIDADIKDGVRSRVIGLTNDYKTCYDRILERSRDGESGYSIDDIKENCFAYDQLYSLLEDESYKTIRVFDLGLLYHQK